jgi:signal transduction histidine kinase
MLGIERQRAWRQSGYIVSLRQLALHGVQLAVPAFLGIAAVIFPIATILGAGWTGQQQSEAILGLLLLGLLGLHLTAMFRRGEYSWTDAALDAGLLALALTTMHLPVLATAAYYLTLGAAVVILGRRDTTAVVALFLASNIIGTIGAICFNHPISRVHWDMLHLQTVEMALVNLVGFPLTGYLFHAFAGLLKQRDANIATLQQSHQDLRISRSRLQLTEKLAALNRFTEGIVREMDADVRVSYQSYLAVEQHLARLRFALVHGLTNTDQGQQIVNEALEAAHAGLHAARKADHFLACLNADEDDAEYVKEFDLVYTLYDAVQAIQPKCERHGCTLHVTLPNERLAVYGEQARLTQALLQVITNAIEAYPAATVDRPIWVNAEAVGDGVVVEITDAGRGIPEAHISRVYERLFTTKPNGAGLGLSIVYEAITQNFGGFVDIYSRDGCGTTVVFTLPRYAIDIDKELAIL